MVRIERLEDHEIRVIDTVYPGPVIVANKTNEHLTIVAAFYCAMAG
jgi:hypothetical protein